MSKILVTYLLSPAGQREALRLGQSGAQRQTTEATTELDRWLALPSLHVDADGVARVGVGTPTTYPDGRGGQYTVPGERPPVLQTTEIGGVTYPSSIGADYSSDRPHMFGAPQTAESLLAWAEARTAEHAAQRAQFELEVEAARPALEAARAAEAEAARQAGRQRLAALLATEPMAEGSAIAEARAILADPAEASRLYLEDSVRVEIGTWRRKQSALVYADERARWVAEHGSAHLRSCLELGLEADRLYRDERLALERPGWAWARQLKDFPESDPRSPSPSATDLLRRARAVEPEARLVWTGDGYAAGGVEFLGDEIWLDQHVTRDGVVSVLRDWAPDNDADE